MGSLVAKRILVEVVVMTLNLEVANTEIMRPQRQAFAKALHRLSDCLRSGGRRCG